MQAQVYVSTTQTWSNFTGIPIGHEDGIILGPGVTLTLDQATLSMKVGSEIIVDQIASKLIIVNSYINSDNPANGDLWKGILVLGNSSMDQYSTFPDPTNLNNTPAWEGILNNSMPQVIINHSTISHAEIGVNSISGGIIRANNTFFIDNEIGVKIQGYEHPNKIVSGQLISGEFINASHIFNSIFEWTKDNSNVSNTDKRGITLSYVDGINIGGCLFANNHKDINGDFVPYCYHQRGTGIYASYASIIATSSGNSFCYDDMGCLKNCSGGNTGSGNTFENLSNGIVSKGGRRRQTSCVVTNSNFNNNYISINSELFPAADYSILKVLENSFHGERALLETMIIDDDGLCGLGLNDIHVIDVLVKNRVGNDIYNNDFNYIGTNITHIMQEDIYNCTPRVINNTFNNTNSSTIASDNVYGVRVAGSNPKLIISCNNFSNMGTDIKIHEDATVKSPMTDKKGNAAYNSFSDVLSGRLRIDNSGNSNIEYKLREPSITDNFHPLSSPTSINVTVQDDEILEEREDEDCQLTCSELVTDNSLSVYQQSSELIKYNLYPNPTTGLITFESEKEFINSYSIYSVTGKIVTSQKEMGHSFSVNTNNYAYGIYYISIQFENGTQLNLKFIVQK